LTMCSTLSGLTPIICFHQATISHSTHQAHILVSAGAGFLWNLRALYPALDATHVLSQEQQIRRQTARNGERAYADTRKWGWGNVAVS